MNRKLPLAMITLACLVGSALAALGMSLERVHDHIIEIKTSRVKQYFDYKNSILAPCVRASISCKSEGADKSVRYEDLWYRGWNCIGCHRFAPLKTAPGHEIALHVVHEDGASVAEQEAAANAIIRMLLDAYASESMVTVVFVPNESLTNIANAMHRASFDAGREAAPEEPVYARMQLELRTPGGERQTLYYNGGR